MTRLYTPEDFGVLAIFVAFLVVLSTVSNLRYSLAIPLPGTDAQALNLLVLALFVVLVSSVVVTTVFLVSGEWIGSQFGTNVSRWYFALLGLGVLADGLYTCFNYWAIRKKAFKHISFTRVEQSVGTVGVQFGLGLFGFGAIGLIIGQIVGLGAGFIGLGRRVMKDRRGKPNPVRISRILATAVRYQRYPRFSTPEALANSGSVQVPILLIAVFTNNAELGFLMLAMRIMQAPLSLVGTAVSQVFYSQAVDEHRSNHLANFTASIIGGLLKIGWGPMLFVAIVAPVLFPIIFGAEWRRAGELLAWITPWYMLQFITSPISMVLHVTENLKISLVLQVSGLIFRGLTVIVAGQLVTGADVSVWYAISGAIFYCIYFVIVARAADLRWGQLRPKFVAAIPLTLIWIAVASLIVYADLWFNREAGL